MSKIMEYHDDDDDDEEDEDDISPANSFQYNLKSLEVIEVILDLKVISQENNEETLWRASGENPEV